MPSQVNDKERTMIRRTYATLLLMASLMGGFVPNSVAAPPQAAAKAPSLYTQLGGYDAIAAVTDDFITRLATDPELGKFFVGLNDASKQRVRQHVIDFLCNATGGPCLYLGQDMKTAHKGLHITEAEWNTSAQHLVATLNKFKVPQPQQTAVMGAISALKGDIVGQ
jgi:hemoglobin